MAKFLVVKKATGIRNVPAFTVYKVNVRRPTGVDFVTSFRYDDKARQEMSLIDFTYTKLVGKGVSKREYDSNRGRYIRNRQKRKGSTEITLLG